MRHPIPDTLGGSRLLLPLLILLVLLLAAAPAGADSLVYVAGGQVYVAAADGSQARAVSPQGRWAWPSESDQGTIAALSTANYYVYEFDQQGNSLLSAPIPTPQSTVLGVGDYYVNHIRISPDGSRLAYNVINCCGESGGSTFLQPTAAGNSSWYDFSDDYINPVWVDASSSNDPYVNSEDGLGLGHNGYNWAGALAGNCCQYGIWDADSGSNSGWKSDTAIPSSDWEFEVAYTRDLKHLALLLDDSPDYSGVAHNVEIVLESIDWANRGVTTDDCTIPLDAGSYGETPQTIDSISYSSDGSTLAWADDSGIHEANVADPTDCSAVNSSVYLAVPGGAYPSFGAAELTPPTPTQTPPTPTTTPTTTTTTPGSSSPTKAPTSGSKTSAAAGPAGPNTKLIKATINRRARSATFRFSGSGGSGKLSFRCQLDRGRWTKCASGKSYKRLRRGNHTFSVEAVDRRGKSDPTPSTKRFKV
ncbi:MAG TPA: hypothetical protein VHU61_18725 [Solirubrobacteraceae bacterium]|nr:hypothetical protein [Solirubrobacteraceae bacterium]